MLNIFGIFFVIRKIFVVEPYWLRIEKTIKPSDHTKSTKRHKTNCHSGKIRGDVLYTLDVGGRVFYIMYATARCYKWVLRQRPDWKGEGALEGGTWSPLWTWGPLGGRGAQKWENLWLSFFVFWQGDKSDFLLILPGLGSVKKTSNICEEEMCERAHHRHCIHYLLAC